MIVSLEIVLLAVLLSSNSITANCLSHFHTKPSSRSFHGAQDVVVSV